MLFLSFVGTHTSMEHLAVPQSALYLVAGKPITARRCGDVGSAYLYATSPSMFTGATETSFNRVRDAVRTRQGPHADIIASFSFSHLCATYNRGTEILVEVLAFVSCNGGNDVQVWH